MARVSLSGPVLVSPCSARVQVRTPMSVCIAPEAGAASKHSTIAIAQCMGDLPFRIMNQGNAQARDLVASVLDDVALDEHLADQERDDTGEEGEVGPCVVEAEGEEHGGDGKGEDGDDDADKPREAARAPDDGSEQESGQQRRDDRPDEGSKTRMPEGCHLVGEHTGKAEDPGGSDQNDERKRREERSDERIDEERPQGALTIRYHWSSRAS